MNENIDLTKILKDCPKGTKLYSSTFGEVEFQYIKQDSIYPIVVKLKNGITESIASNGKIFYDYDGECILFPSKDQRDWSKFSAPWFKKDKFDPKALKPFDKVLARHYYTCEWKIDFYSHKGVDSRFPYICVGNSLYKYCIPYNDETKHLVGTAEEAPEYYRYWED